MKKITVFDSTLRDGAQGEGIAFSVEDKVNITKALDLLGVDYIEAGNPGSNPKDLEFFRRIKNETLKNAKLCAFGSTRRKNIEAKDDANVVSLLDADTPAVSIFGKCWDLHVTDVINTTLDENLNMIRDTISYLKQQGKYVMFDAEHFYDGYLNNAEYAIKALHAAKNGGADVLCLCDTNGGTYLKDIYDITKAVTTEFTEIEIGIHCHNDTGLAVAQTMLAIDAGAIHVQGTLIGIGERCGNTNLSTIIGNLQLKRGYMCIPEENMSMLTETARRIADIANIWLPSTMPYVGASAFAHKGGMHVDGVSKVSRSFEHVPPDSVGNTRHFVMSEVAGKATLIKRIQRVEPGIDAKSPVVAEILKELKQREFEGYQYEAAEQSFHLLIRRILEKHQPYFKLEYFKTIGEEPHSNTECPASAIVKVNVKGEKRIGGGEGDGPVHAMDVALRSVLESFYPALKEMRLTDYKVRVIESSETTAAKVRVLIESSDGKNTWNTIGVSYDILEASFLALSDSIEYKLMMDESPTS